MPAVKKLKSINFITRRNLVISALAVYTVEVQSYRIDRNLELEEDDKNKIKSQLSELKSHFYQGFKVDYKDVFYNSVPLIMDKLEEQLDFSQKDISSLNKVYDRYIELLKKSEKQPIKLRNKFPRAAAIEAFLGVDVKLQNSSQWLYKGFAYEIQGHYSEDEIRLLILEDFDKERRMFEKLRAKFDDVTSDDLNYERPRIPEKVRIEVWRRDGGKCSRCGGREKLEYDHIVPISKGGSNTARNIELLCEKHNRSKSNNVV
jgi:hypothetical protein